MSQTNNTLEDASYEEEIEEQPFEDDETGVNYE